MHQKYLFLLTIGLISSFNPKNTLAQSVSDAAKYSQTSTFATARSVGFGGALGSVGGDFSSLSVNPAGIGIYRKSEFMVTPGLRFNGTNTDYSGSSSADNNVRFGFNNNIQLLNT